MMIKLKKPPSFIG